MNRKQLGAEGERFVREQLQLQHYTIVDTNWRCRFGEIDIIAKKDNQLYFIEVRTRTVYKGMTNRFGEPIEAIHQTKIKKLYQLAQLYCYSKGDKAYQYQVLFAPVSYESESHVFHLEQLYSIH